MQISSISSTANAFTARRICDTERIRDLEQKHIRIQSASEGYTGGLDAKDAYELELRRERQSLVQEQIAYQQASEGCNASLAPAKLNRIQEINKILSAMEETEECSCGFEHHSHRQQPTYVDNRSDDIRYWNY